MQLLVSLLIVFASASSTAFDGQEALQNLTGSFQAKPLPGTNTKNYQYIECRSKQPVQMDVTKNKLTIKGLGKFDIEFRDVNQGPVGMPGPLIGFSQRETRFREIGENLYLMESRNRQCEPLIGKLGCFGKRWRVTQSLTFYQQELSDESVADFSYSPFKGSAPEVCALVKYD